MSREEWQMHQDQERYGEEDRTADGNTHATEMTECVKDMATFMIEIPAIPLPTNGEVK